jgi:hypothetical protein
MELSTVTVEQVDVYSVLKEKLDVARRLISFINEPLLNDCDGVDKPVNESLCWYPCAFACFTSFKAKSINELSQTQRFELKQELKKDIAPLIEEAEEKGLVEKTFNKEKLPTEPDTCLVCISEKMTEKRKRIDELEKDFEALENAKCALESLKETQEASAAFKEEMFASTPSNNHEEDKGGKKAKNSL